MFGCVEAAALPWPLVRAGIRLRLLRQDLLPNTKIFANCRSAVRVPFHGREQHQQLCIPWEDALRGASARKSSPIGLVEMLETASLRKVSLLRLIEARQNVIIWRQPAVIFCEQMKDEVVRGAHACAPQLFPVSLSAAGNEDLS